MTSRGFTLLEVLVAVMILSLAVLAAFGAQSNAIATRNYIEDSTVALGLARCRMSEIDNTIRTFGNFEEADVQEEGPCCALTDRNDFTCLWKIEAVNLPEYQADAESGDSDMIKQGVSLAFGEKAATRFDMMGGFSGFAKLFMPMLSNILTQGIRRVTVTVEWQRSDKPKELTLTQFMVNPSLGGLSLLTAAAQAQNAANEGADQSGGGPETSGGGAGAKGGRTGTMGGRPGIKAPGLRR